VARRVVLDGLSRRATERLLVEETRRTQERRDEERLVRRERAPAVGEDPRRVGGAGAAQEVLPLGGIDIALLARELDREREAIHGLALGHGILAAPCVRLRVVAHEEPVAVDRRRRQDVE